MGSYELPEEGSPNSTADPRIKTMLKGLNEALDSSNKLEAKSLSAGALGRWYTPLTIETESERESATFGAMTLADEIKNVVLPTRGLIVVGYMAKWKCSVASAGRAAIFLGTNQLKNPQTASAVEAEAGGTTEYSVLSSSVNTAGLATSTGGATALTTTGMPLSASTGSGGGLAYVFASAGTYNVSIQFRATSGKVFAKERTLWVGVIGV